MIGVAEQVLQTFSDDELIALFDARGRDSLDHTGIYSRPNGDTMTLPLRSHLRWIGDDKRYSLIEVVDAAKVKREVGEYLARKSNGKGRAA